MATTSQSRWVRVAVLCTYILACTGAPLPIPAGPASADAATCCPGGRCGCKAGGDLKNCCCAKRKTAVVKIEEAIDPDACPACIEAKKAVAAATKASAVQWVTVIDAAKCQGSPADDLLLSHEPATPIAAIQYVLTINQVEWVLSQTESPVHVVIAPLVPPPEYA